MSLVWTRVQKPPQNDIHMTRHCSCLTSIMYCREFKQSSIEFKGILLISREKNSHIPEWIQRARLNSYRDPPSCISPHNYCYQSIKQLTQASVQNHSMCDYTKVSYQCGHVRYLVKAWCVRYQQTQQRCPPNVVAT